MDGVEARLAELTPEQRELFGLLSRVQGLAGDGAPTPGVEPPEVSQAPAPLSFAQERIWRLEQLAPGSPAYNAAVVVELRGRLGQRALARALSEIVRRHSILRSAVVVERDGAAALADGTPLQAVAPPAPLPLPVIDLAALPPPGGRAEAERLCRAGARLPFRLAASPRSPRSLGSPLLRAWRLALGGEESWLLLASHHLAVDGWSFGVLAGELGALYTAYARGAGSPLPEPPLQYADYALWQRRRLASGALDGEVAYWRRQLAGAPRGLELPADRPRHGARGLAGASRALALPAALEAPLAGFCRSANVTPFMALLAAFQALLGAYGGQRELVVGTAVSNRLRADLEGLIGPFANSLPLRADLAGDPAFVELLARVRETTLAAFAHQELPFERLVELAAEPVRERDGREQPLFQAVFALHDAPWESLELPGLALRWRPLALGTARFDLTLEVVRSRAGTLLLLEYSSELFDPPTSGRLAGHYANLLAAAVANPRRRLSGLPLLGAAERFQLLREWNDAASVYPRDAALDDLFAAQARRSPAAVAVESAAGELTYGALATWAGAAALRLRALGVGPEARVGLCCQGLESLVVGTLAILAAGGAYVPLDPASPPDRLAAILADAGVSVVVAERRLLPRLPPAVPSCLLVDEVERPAGAGAQAEAFAAALPAHPLQLAYVMYTSGSTGRPKGVAVPHRAVVRLVLGSNYVALQPDDRVAQAANPAFDAVTFEVWGALLAGARLVEVPPAARLSPAALAGFLRERRITTLFLTPALFNQAAAELPGAFSGLRHLLLGGQALDPGTVGQVLAAGGPGRLLNGYGPTESTTFAAWHRVRAVPPGAASVPIGRPLANTRLHVLDRDGRPAPVGVRGELAIGGDGLARGYAGAAAETARSFVPDPFAEVPGERLYRTGDLVRRLPDGSLDFAGRLDDQVKIRGFRVEPAEVEVALARHPGVRQAVVAARQAAGEWRLAAWVVAGADPPPDAAALRRFLAGQLPDYMVPAAFVTLPALPLSPHGKVDRAALPEPDWAHPEGGAAFVPPAGPAERRLAAIWEEVLRVERVGADDDFFALGGDSILAIQIASRAERAGLRLTPRALFEHPTVGRLAAALAGAAPEGDAGGLDAPPRQPPQPAPAAEPASGPLRPTPIAWWFFEQRLAHPHHFTQSVLLEALQPLAPPLLAAALDALLRRHDALRLRAAPAGEPPGWRLRIAPPGEAVAWTQVDLAALAGPAPASTPVPAAVSAAVTAAVGALEASLDLARGPILRAAYFDLGPGRPARLALVAHHLAVDGVSWRILLEELATAWRQLAGGRPVELPPPTASLRRWAERLAELADAPESRAEASYWLAAPRRAVRRLPVDHPGGANTVASTRTLATALATEETAALLREVPRASGAGVDAALLAALAQALAAWTGAGDLLIDLERHGREGLAPELDLTRTVGWLTAIAPVLLRPGRQVDPAAVLGAVQDELRRLPRGGAGYGLLRYLAADRELARALAALPAAEVSCNYLGRLDAGEPAGGPFRLLAEASGHGRSPQAVRRHLLEVDAWIAGGCLRLDWRFSVAVHDRATIERLAAACLAALRGMIAHCRGAERGSSLADSAAAALTRAELDELAASAAAAAPASRLAAVFPLSPVQEGILFHCLTAPETGIYHEQLTCLLDGDLDAGLLRRAWQRALDRHPALRTQFAWEGRSEPVQLVLERVELPWSELDWSEPDRGDAPPAARAARGDRLAAWCATDRARGFALGTAPLLRLALARQGAAAPRLLWSFHHLILDGWSVALVLAQVLADYAALRRGEERPLPPAAGPADVLARLARRDRAADEAFWREELRGFAAPTPLAVERAISPTASAADFEAAGAADADDAGAAWRERELRLPPAATAALRARGARHRLTVNTLCEAAWALLLGRYSGEPEVVFGEVVADRPAEVAGVEEAVGLFINTLPVRVALPPREPVAAWIAALQRRQLAARQHQHAALPEIQGWSEVPRGLPLFTSVLACENYPLDGALAAGAGGLVLREVRFSERTHYPLTLLVIPGDELLVRAIWDERRLDAAAALRLLGHLETLLLALPEALAHADLADTALASAGGGAARGPALEDLSPLGAAERHQLLCEWSGSGAPPPAAAAGPYERFAAQAARTPEAVALVYGEERLTYRELHCRVAPLAERLRALGAGPEVRVAICAARSPHLLAGLLAVLAAGGAYVPLDPSQPAERLAFMLADSGAALLLGDGGAAAALAATAAPGVLVVDLAAAPPLPPAARPAPIDPDHLAYVLYTSGSTGRPKGVEVLRGGAAALLAWAAATYTKQELDRVLAATSIGFDLSVFEIFAPWSVGGAVVLAESPLALPALPEAGAVTLLNTVPSAAAELLRAAGIPATVRTVNLAGEALPPQLARELLARPGGGRLFNLYGPTEATTYATAAAFSSPSAPAAETAPAAGAALAAPVPIGRPLPGTRVYLLDEALRPVPLGAPGEIWLGGAGLARGYLGRPEWTAERFLPAPPAAAAAPGERLYRTGDRGRFRADGQLEFLGRTDHQLKVRGVRVEPGEIEAVLAAHPGVREAVVVARRQGPDDLRLVAYLACRGDAPPSAGELRAHLRRRLPEPMVPSAFVGLAALPRTPHGKVDRRALPPPGDRPAGDAAAAPYRPPQGALEREIAAIWQEVLGLERVGRDDPFFDLGGHSLRLLRVHGRLRERLGVELPLLELFRLPTVAALAARLARGAAADTSLAGPRSEALRQRAARQRRGRRRAAAAAGEPIP